KPIYFLTAYLEFPDDAIGGIMYGVHLSWGDPEKLDDHNFANADAQHVEPGKTFVLTIPEMYIKGLRAMHRMRQQVTKNQRLWFEKIYFGDGTGFESEGHWQDFRGNAPPLKPDKKHHPGPSTGKVSIHSSASTSVPICGGAISLDGLSQKTPPPRRAPVVSHL